MITATAPKIRPSPVQEHVAATYFTLRLGLGIIAVAFPFALWLGGNLYAGLPLQDSMSAYYHGELGGRSMRNWFVGGLFAIGALLYLYKGFSPKENYALNIAGVMVVLVAVFPMEWQCGASCARFTIHGTAAVLAFLCIAFVAAFCAVDTLRLIRDEARRKRLERTYRGLAVLMLVSPLVAFVLSSVVGLRSALIFFVEASGMLAFAAYWVTKSREMRQTHADLMALEGALVADWHDPLGDDEGGVRIARDRVDLAQAG